MDNNTDPKRGRSNYRIAPHRGTSDRIRVS